MTKKTTLKPLAVAMGAAFVTSLAGAGVANAADNPFAMSDLSSGYMVADSHTKGMEGKCGEGKCGEKMKSREGKCGEGKCGMKSLDADGDGNITREEFMHGHESMFGKMDANGDGKLDAAEQDAGMKMMKEGNCGEKSKMEGKCGEKMMKPDEGEGSEGEGAK